MELPELPKPPTVGEVRREVATGVLPWSRLHHLAATRGSPEAPGPLLWTDALVELAECGDPGYLPGPGGLGVVGAVEAEVRDERLRARVIRCLEHLETLPELTLETKWLRQTPREDAPFVYTGSLFDVMASASLEDAALRLSRLFRTVDSYDYSRELIRDASAWDGRDAHGLGLRLAHAAARRAAWNHEDPAERERARAILLRWLGYLHGRRPSLPARPPRGPSARFPVGDVLTEWSRRSDGPTRSGENFRARLTDLVSTLVTLGRVQEDTRVMERSLHEAWMERWEVCLALGDSAIPIPAATGSASRPATSPLDASLREDLLAADFAWVARAVSPDVAAALARGVPPWE